VYTDPAGNDHTPGSNSFVLGANAGVGYRPIADDTAEGPGQSVPNAAGGAPVSGSVFIRATGQISGRLVILDGDALTSSAMALPAFGTTAMSVPFYLDNGPNLSGAFPPSGVASFIGIKNMTASTITVTLIYTDAAGSDHTPLTNTFQIGPFAAVGYRPVADDGAEGPGQSVPNSTGPVSGSVIITATGRITGRLVILDGDNVTSSAMLLPNHE
jgi:hypothetical protein